jgi:hypothetical protein
MADTKKILHPEVRHDPPHPPISDGIDESAVTSGLISPARIAERAYALYERRGREEGHALDDWLQAERELTEQQNR